MESEQIKLCACGCGRPVGKNRYIKGHRLKVKKLCINGDGNPSWCGSDYCKECFEKLKAKPRPCACGCGMMVTNPNPKIKYYPGHNSKMQVIMNAEPRPCACGCGQMVTSKDPRVKYIQGHSSRNKELMNQIKEKMEQTCLEKYGVKNAVQSKLVQEKIKQSCLEKYGVDNASKSQKVIQKIKDVLKEKDELDPDRQNKITEKRKITTKERYGVDFVAQKEEFKEKSRQTCLERYGVEYILSNKEFRDSWKEIFMEKYGVEYAGQIPELIERNKKHFLEKYGVDNPSKAPEVIETIKQSNLKKYGVEWSIQNEEVKNKSKETCLEKYGVDNPFKSKEIIKEILESIRQKIWDSIQLRTDWEPMFTKEEFLKHGWSENDTSIHYDFKCKKCGHIQKLSCYFVSCEECNPIKHGRSRQEIEVTDFIKSILPDTEILTNDRTLIPPKELDIYIPSKKLAIEFDGLFWHSIPQIDDPNYHIDKTNECEAKGVQLIHIFEDEWLEKQNIVKSMIKSRLGIFDKTIYARQCEVKEIKDTSYIDFLMFNHVQGYNYAKVSYGLYHNNELVSVMTFGSYRRSMGKQSVPNEYEMYRFCNKIGYHIPGGASKLFKHFIDDYKPKKVISYCDRRWSVGNLYNKLGFTFVKNTQPNYWYIRGITRENRFKYRKSQLQILLEKFNPEFTEQQNMLDNGFDIMYDCGSKLFIYEP